MGLGEYERAAPLLLKSFHLLVERQAKIPKASRKGYLREAAERLVRLYTAWKKPAAALAWRNEMAMYGGPAVAEPRHGFVPLDFPPLQKPAIAEKP